VDANRKLYELFYNRIGETDVTGELESAQARIVSPAVVPRSAYWPNKRRIVGLAFLLTVFAGISVVVLLEAMNSSIRSSSDVEEKLKQDLLGMVPLLKRKSRKHGLGELFFDEREHGFGEAFRTIRTAVSLDNLEKPHKIIVVTSSIDREGKSTVAMNLAHAFARGEKVLLLDADMRRPSIGQELRLPKNALGFAELLDGTAKLVDCVVPGEPGRVDILPHGHIPQDPQKLLSSTRLSRALLVLKNNYDRIIIDTPPVLPVSDALMLSKQADAVIVVAKSDATSARQINQALHLLARVGSRVIGVVVNQLDVRKAGKYSDYGYGGYYDSYESTSAAS
jgi:capsular exopolysaccharide synthesis family protein